MNILQAIATRYIRSICGLDGPKHLAVECFRGFMLEENSHSKRAKASQNRKGQVAVAWSHVRFSEDICSDAEQPEHGDDPAIWLAWSRWQISAQVERCFWERVSTLCALFEAPRGPGPVPRASRIEPAAATLCHTSRIGMRNGARPCLGSASKDVKQSCAGQGLRSKCD